jgi:hypothetical protein
VKRYTSHVATIAGFVLFLGLFWFGAYLTNPNNGITRTYKVVPIEKADLFDREFNAEEILAPVEPQNRHHDRKPCAPVERPKVEDIRIPKNIVADVPIFTFKTIDVAAPFPRADRPVKEVDSAVLHKRLDALLALGKAIEDDPKMFKVAVAVRRFEQHCKEADIAPTIQLGVTTDELKRISKVEKALAEFEALYANPNGKAADIPSRLRYP